MRRLFVRQTQNGAHPETARHRIATNDRPNAEQIAETRGVADVLVCTAGSLSVD
jgi:hypothetical protein